jgi:UDP-N-acetyl-D-glucosamine dehydrogenase
VGVQTFAKPRLAAAPLPLPAPRSAPTSTPHHTDDDFRFRHDIAIVGLGYVGLPTALAFHAAGKRVLGVDVSAARLVDVRVGAVDLLPLDHERLRDALHSDRFLLECAADSLSDAQTVVICVPTPIDDHQVPELGALQAACASVVRSAVRGQTIILTSTSYVGTTNDLLGVPLTARGLRPGTDIHVAFSPERIDPGNTAHAHEDVPRVVGGLTAACTERAAASLGGYVKRVHRVSSAETAEFTKLYENTFRAVNIAYANEMSVAARSLGLDIGEVIDAAATKPFGFMAFRPGPGVGGHCIPCDPHYLLWQLRSARQNLPLVGQAMTSIAERPAHVVQRVAEELAAIGKVLAGANVLVVGVSYKPGVADVRESPALVIIEALIAAGAEVSYVDPHIPVITLSNGSALVSRSDMGAGAPDLALLHTAHAGLDLTGLPEGTVVLNATSHPISTSAKQRML